MRVLTILAFGLWASVAQAQQDPTADIQTVITQQLEAFKAQDLDAAWLHASPMIKMMFRDQTNFGAMVQRGYPMVWDNQDRRFLELRKEAGRLWQTVRVTDRNGGVHYLDYQMIPTENGWQINGVQLAKAPDVGV